MSTKINELHERVIKDIARMIRELADHEYRIGYDAALDDFNKLNVTIADWLGIKLVPGADASRKKPAAEEAVRESNSQLKLGNASTLALEFIRKNPGATQRNLAAAGVKSAGIVYNLINAGLVEKSIDPPETRVAGEPYVRFYATNAEAGS